MPAYCLGIFVKFFFSEKARAKSLLLATVGLSVRIPGFHSGGPHLIPGQVTKSLFQVTFDTLRSVQGLYIKEMPIPRTLLGNRFLPVKRWTVWPNMIGNQYWEFIEITGQEVNFFRPCNLGYEPSCTCSSRAEELPMSSGLSVK